MHKKQEYFIFLFSSIVSTLLAQCEYDDIEEVGRHLVETTSLMRDGLKIQSVNGEEVQGLDVYFVFDVSKSITLVEAIDFAKVVVEKV